MHGIRRKALLSVCFMALGAGAARADEAAASAVQLAPLTVQGTAEEPASTSTLTEDQLRNFPPTEARDLLIGIPGVFSQDDGTPGLAISVRGMQDFGRVNVMIDGARQDFQVTGHGANGTVFVDPALLAGVDVQRGTVSTANGAGAIGGVVDLHTLDVDDVLAKNQHIGLLTTDMAGTNNYDGSGMIAGAARISDSLGVVGAFSLRSSGDYKDGSGTTVPDTFQRLQSGLVKADIVPGADQTLQIGGVFYHNSFGASTEGVVMRDSVESNTVTAKYHWAPAADPRIDLHVNAYYVGTTMDDFTPSFVGLTVAPADTTHYHLTTLGFTADNLSTFQLGGASLALDYGGEYYHDDVHTSDDVGDTGETPSGTRQVGSVFTQATLGWDKIQLIGGLRYDHYSLNGSGVNDTGGFTSTAAGPFTIDKSSGAVSPKGTLAVTPIAGLELYGSYGLGYRPPALTETLFAGTHPGLDFLRFIPNPDLDPERTRGWELGTKLGYHDLLRGGDSLTLKGDYFHTNIEHYIAQTLVTGGLDPNVPYPIPLYGYFYQNTEGTTVSKGFELEGSYDAGFAYTTLAYTNTITTLGSADYTGFSQILTAPPRNVLASTVGVRLFDENLTLGERTRLASSSEGQPTSGTATVLPGYTLVDLFGRWRVTPTLQAFASVENLGNKQYYADSLASVASTGRTAKIGFTLAFGS